MTNNSYTNFFIVLNDFNELASSELHCGRIEYTIVRLLNDGTYKSYAETY